MDALGGAELGVQSGLGRGCVLLFTVAQDLKLVNCSFPGFFIVLLFWTMVDHRSLEGREVKSRVRGTVVLMGPWSHLQSNSRTFASPAKETHTLCQSFPICDSGLCPGEAVPHPRPRLIFERGVR